MAKGKTFIQRWDRAFENGSPCGIVEKIGREHHAPNKYYIKAKPDGLFATGEVIHDIPEGGYKEITSMTLPGLGINTLIIVLTSGMSDENNLGTHMNNAAGSLASELAKAKEKEATANAAKDMEAHERSQSDEVVMEKYKKQLKDLKEGAGMNDRYERP